MIDRRKNTFISVLILIPSILLVGLFIYGFIGNTIVVSLSDWGHRLGGLAFDPEKNFAGLENYRQLFSGFVHGRFRQDLVNAVFYSILLMAGTLFFGFLFAVLLDRKVRAEGFFRSLFLYPMALSFIVTGTIWRWLFAPSGGVNIIPTFFGGTAGTFLWISSRAAILQFNWQDLFQVLSIILAFIFLILLIRSLRTGSPKGRTFSIVMLLITLLYASVIHRRLPPILPFEEMHGFNLATLGICIASIWQYSGYAMALYLAGLRALPESIRESAQLDGANEFIYYMRIAIPNLKPITLSAVIVLAHISLKMFDLIYAMAGADNAKTGHPSINMYLTTFRANNFASGAAMAVVLFLLAALFIIPYLIHTHRERRG
jgi:glucose/mannose transport system permease protein